MRSNTTRNTKDSLTPTIKAEIIKLYKQGLFAREIVEKMNYSKPSVAFVLHEAGFKMGHGHINPFRTITVKTEPAPTDNGDLLEKVIEKLENYRNRIKELEADKSRLENTIIQLNKEKNDKVQSITRLQNILSRPD